MKLDENYAVAAANDLVTGHQKMTLRESQLLALAISQIPIIEPDDYDKYSLKTYTTTVPELAAFMGIEEQSLYKDLRGICRSLCQRIVEVQKGENKWEIYSWVQSARYDNGILKLRLSDDLKPYLVSLQAFYTQPLLSVLLTFNSYYATRLYMYLKAVNGSQRYGQCNWDFTCEQLRELFQTEVKDLKGNVIRSLYKQNRDLIKKTIKPALDELHKSPYVYVYDYEEYTQRKSGQRGKPSLAGVRFKTEFFEDDDHLSAAQKKDLFIACKEANMLEIAHSSVPELTESQASMPDFEDIPVSAKTKPKKRGRPAAPRGKK